MSHTFEEIGWIVRYKVSTPKGYVTKLDSLSFSLSKQNCILSFNGRTADKTQKFKVLEEKGMAHCIPVFIRLEDCSWKRKRKKTGQIQTSSGADPPQDSSQ